MPWLDLDHSVAACLRQRHIHIGAILSAHSVCAVSHMQHHANCEASTTSLFLQQITSQALFIKVESGIALYILVKHNFVGVSHSTDVQSFISESDSIWGLQLLAILGLQLLATRHFTSTLFYGRLTIFLGHYCQGYYCDRKGRVACAQSFAPWQQATKEFTRRDHSVITCSHHIDILLFFVHIPFMVNHTINATPPERLQQHLLLCTNRTNRTFSVWRLNPAQPLHPGHSTTLLTIGKPERHVRKASHRGSKQQLSSHATITIIACSRHIYILLFFAHIPFMVNHTINATPLERLQHQQQWKFWSFWTQLL